MHLEFDKDGYVCCILYGCTTGSCSEYTGLVPTEPEEYADLDEWADNAQTQAYYLDDNGNLAYDPERAAALCPEDEVVLKRYTSDDVKALGIFDAIYPVGSLYMSMNDVDPSILFGGTWAKIEDRFLLASGTFAAGEENAAGLSSEVTVNIPAHKHLTPIMNNGNAFGLWTGGDKVNMTLAQRLGVGGAIYSDSYTATTYYTAEDGACSTSVTVPPTIPPFMAVFVWQRVEDAAEDTHVALIDSEGNTVIDRNTDQFLLEVD